MDQGPGVPIWCSAAGEPGAAQPKVAVVGGMPTHSAVCVRGCERRGEWGYHTWVMQARGAVAPGVCGWCTLWSVHLPAT